MAEAAYLKSQLKNDTNYYFYNDVNYDQCNEGYTGRICGKCTDAYGRTTSKCEECFKDTVYTVLLILLQYMILIGVIIYFIKNVLDLIRKLDFNRKLKESINKTDFEMKIMSEGLSSQS